LKVLILITSLTLLACSLLAAPLSNERYEIDAKRIGVYYNSENAMARSREFKRIDSSYYVGWMYEGTYRYERASDYRGFKLAGEQLQKALDLLYKDFKKEITTRTGMYELFYRHYQLRRDYDYMVYHLMNCYSNMDRADLVWKHLQWSKRINHQHEVYADTYCYLGWTVHRNRFHTSKKYSFLKNSIEENEQYANKLLDSAVLKLKADAVFNNKMFSSDYVADNMSSVWHYRSILYSYQLDIERADKTYNKLKGTYYFPENNYATYCAIQGKFREATFYYNQAKIDQGDKRLDESFYYSSILNIYRGLPKESIQEIKDIMSANGTTPGFGWYNIALARGLLYDGQLKEAKKHTLKAEQFKEIHIGTTLGQSHYDFTNALLQLVIKQREIQQIKFSKRSWWYSFSSLSKLAQLSTEKFGLQFLIINQLAANPERELVIYKLFSTENTVSYDEIWSLINDFSTNFFLKQYKKYAEEDNRPKLRKYYQYFIARLSMEKGDYQKAMKDLKEVLTGTDIDTEYENLFLSRVYLAYAQCLQKAEDKTNAQLYIHKAYEDYPQLIPFQSLRVAMRLQAKADTDEEKEILAYLKKMNVNWIDKNKTATDAIDVYVKFGTKQGYKTISFETSYQKNTIVQQQMFSYKETAKAAKELGLYIFNVGNVDKALNMNEPTVATNY
jgi:hypothetical protein